MLVARHVLFALVLAAAFGLPYLLSQDSLFESAHDVWNSVVGSRRVADRETVASAPSAAPHVAAPPPSPQSSSLSHKTEKTIHRLREIAAQAASAKVFKRPTITGPSTTHPAELFRFDVPPEWVRTNWPQVTMVPAASELEVYRVPIMTGTAPHDVTGSMSYYFDGTRHVQRLTFRGTTHDPRPLINVLTSHYRLQPKPSLGGRLFSTEHEGRVHNLMIVDVDPPTEGPESLPVYRLELELNRPDHNFGTTDWMEEALRTHTAPG